MSEWVEGKWIWMVDWCKSKRLHPGDARNWELAEEAYNEAHSNKDKP